MPATPSTPPVLPPADPLAGPRAWAHIMYGLHAFSALSGVLTSATVLGAFLFGWPSILAIVLNFMKRDEVAGTWLATHYRWQWRTFWFAFVWVLVAGVLALTIIGIFAAIAVIFLAGVWVLYRVIRGWVALVDRRPMPVPPPL